LSQGSALLALERVMRGVDAVVHLAWAIQPSFRTSYLIRANVGATARVIEAVVHADVRHLVHMSSVAVYSPGPKEPAVDETWPAAGFASLDYSRHKVAVESQLKKLRESSPEITVSWMRSALIFQRAAASGIARYFFPFLPGPLARATPVLPFDPAMITQVVHADDVADALVRVLQAKVSGPFNIAAAPPVSPDRLADLMNARLVPVPTRLMRAAVAASWQLRAQPLAPGWLDLLRSSPTMSSARAHTELGWSATLSSGAVIEELIDGLATGSGGDSEAIRPRDSIPGAAKAAFTRGPIGLRART
jgi:nucleoside-diphosphate-sugar epimerase